MLNLLELFPIGKDDLAFGTPGYIHLFAEALKIAFADRRRYMADPERVLVPVEWLTSRAYADQRRRTIKVGHVIKVRPVWSIKDARLRLERLLGEAPTQTEWLAFERCMQELAGAHDNGKSAALTPSGAMPM